MGSMICAYGYGKDACQGDSGGPAILTDNSSGMSYQSAIISWGDSCGVAPGVYTNLESPAIMNFINERMCQRLVPEMCTNGIFYGVKNDDSDDDNNGKLGVPTTVPSFNLSPQPSAVPSQKSSLNPSFEPTNKPISTPSSK